MKLRLSFVIMAAFALNCSSQSRFQAQPSGQFLVEVNTVKQFFVPGEPVGIQLIITYAGSSGISVPHPLDNEGYREDLEMALPGEADFRRLISDEEAEEARANRLNRRPLILYEPDARHIRTNWYQCWPRMKGLPVGLVFPTAGDYVLRAVVSWQGKTNYATTRVVLNARSLDEQRAYEWLERSGSLCSLKGMWDAARDPRAYGGQASRFRELREQFPTTAFTLFLDQTYMRASNIIARPDNKFLHLLGEKPKPTRASP